MSRRWSQYLNDCSLIPNTIPAQSETISDFHHINLFHLQHKEETTAQNEGQCYDAVHEMSRFRLFFTSNRWNRMITLRHVLYVHHFPFLLVISTSTHLLTILNGYSFSNRCCCTNISLSMLIFEFTHLHSWEISVYCKKSFLHWTM